LTMVVLKDGASALTMVVLKDGASALTMILCSCMWTMFVICVCLV
jgi:hypothetical protein